MLTDKNVLLMLYANWCDHCHETMPLFAALAVDNAAKILTAKIDCAGSTPNTNICRRLKVRAFPAFIHFNNNRMIKYYGDNSMSDLLDFTLVRAKDTWINQSKQAFRIGQYTGTYTLASEMDNDSWSLLLVYALTAVIAAAFSIIVARRCLPSKLSKVYESLDLDESIIEGSSGNAEMLSIKN